jgi:hypothetical protein
MFELNTIKEVLQIRDHSKDTAINALIPAVSDFIAGYCKNPGLLTETPAGLLLAFSVMVNHLLNKRFTSGVTSEALGEHSIGTALDFSQAILKMLSPYKRIKVL